MPQFEDQTVGDLTIRIDRTLCVGFGDCITVAPEAFEFDDEGIAVFRTESHSVARAQLIEACEACPVDAITAVDADGTQLAP